MWGWRGRVENLGKRQALQEEANLRLVGQVMELENRLHDLEARARLSESSGGTWDSETREVVLLLLERLGLRVERVYPEDAKFRLVNKDPSPVGGKPAK